MRKLLVFAGLALASRAGAEGIEFWFLAGQTLMSNGGLGTNQCAVGELCLGATSSDVSLGDGFHFGFKGGFNSGEHLGYEVGYMYNRTSLQFNNPSAVAAAGLTGNTASEGMAYHQVTFNALYYITNPDAKWRPFVTGGVGFTNYAQPGSSAAYGGGTTKLGLNYGGGVKYRLTDRLALRLDVGQSTTPKPFGLAMVSGWLRETELSAGVGVRF
jgi:opacity protein-like surface antigen